MLRGTKKAVKLLGLMRAFDKSSIAPVSVSFLLGTTLRNLDSRLTAYCDLINCSLLLPSAVLLLLSCSVPSHRSFLFEFSFFSALAKT